MEKSPNYREKSKMYEACVRTREDDIKEARELLQELFFQGTVGSRVRDAQRALREWGDNRVADIFNGKARRIDGYELETLRALKRARQLKEARREYAVVTDDIARLEVLLAQADAPFHSEAISALGAIRRALLGSRTPGAGK